MGGKFKSPGIKGDSGGLVLMAGLEPARSGSRGF